MTFPIHFKFRSLLVGGFLLYAVSGCGGDQTCGSLTEPLVVASVDLAPATLVLRQGQVRQYRATPLTNCNHPVADAVITWTSADSSVASVSSAGVVAALRPGTTSITALSEGKSAVAALTVTAIPIAKVSVSPTPAQVEQGLTVTLSATVTDSAGTVIQDHMVVWTSSDSAIALVNGSGVVTGVAAGGPVTISATADTTSGVALVTVVPPPPAVLMFSVEPTDVVAGQEVAPSVQVTVADRFGSPVVGDASPVTLVLESNPGGATLGGTRTVTAVNGIATFSDLTLDKAGAGYTLAANAPGLSTSGSAPFDVTHAAPAELVFSVEPSDATAGASISPAVTVSVLDQFGNLASADTVSVSVSLGQNPAGGTLSGTTRVAPVNGVATFAALRLDKTGAGYTLVASRAGLAGTTSGPFAIFPGPAARLAFTVDPSNATAGTAIAPEIQVTLFDAFDNIVDSDVSTVSLSIGSNPGGSTLSGALTSSVVGGVARFPDIRLNRAGNGYTLLASRAGVPDAASASFAVTAGPPIALAYLVEPSTAVAGSHITPPVQVAVVDGFGNTITNSAATIDIQLADNPGGSTLSGTASANAVQGIATFSDLSLNKTGSGYTLHATTSGLVPVTSQGFAVRPGPPVRLSFAVQPSETPPNQPITPPVEVTVLDLLGNVVDTATTPITISLVFNPGSSVLSGTRTRNAINGVAVFDDLSLDQIANGYLLSSSSPGLVGSLSSLFDIKF